MDTLIKERKSKLAPFEAALLEMEAARKTLVEIQHWLAAQHVTVSTMAVSKFPTSRRRRRWQAQMLDKLACRQPVGQAVPAPLTHSEPDLETLIKLSRLLIFQHTSWLVTGTECARQSAQITRMVIDYINRQTDNACRGKRNDPVRKEIRDPRTGDPGEANPRPSRS